MLRVCGCIEIVGLQQGTSTQVPTSTMVSLGGFDPVLGRSGDDRRMGTSWKLRMLQLAALEECCFCMYLGHFMAFWQALRMMWLSFSSLNSVIPGNTGGFSAIYTVIFVGQYSTNWTSTSTTIYQSFKCLKINLESLWMANSHVFSHQNIPFVASKTSGWWPMVAHGPNSSLSWYAVWVYGGSHLVDKLRFQQAIIYIYIIILDMIYLYSSWAYTPTWRYSNYM